MKHAFLLVAVLVVAGCKPPNGGPVAEPTDYTGSLAEARKGFVTRLARQSKANEPVPTPPAWAYKKVEYDSPVGKLAAYVTPNPKDGYKRPAIIWITGGHCNTIGDVWEAAPPSSDETAAQYRKAGLVMMFPSLRGGNTNPGTQENFYGEVDDVLAAADYLAKQDHVDPKRIYLGGHSTGGTLAMLVAEYSPRFRAVFSFGPAHDISGYPGEFVQAVNLSDRKEVDLRSPGKWLHSIQSPTFVFEGAGGNVQSLETMASTCTNPKGHFFTVKGANHFNVLAPVNALIAQKILKDTPDECNIAFTEAELRQAVGK
ncbi:alpha/beta hydrolase family protein [Gemmata sp.]|uniref:alpha/beta hydrolase family protein n=1 Tax=Gemmata sp. TaxID=1914242 RepID=UPI003F7308D0